MTQADKQHRVKKVFGNRTLRWTPWGRELGLISQATRKRDRIESVYLPEGRERQYPMQPSPESASTSLPEAPGRMNTQRQPEDLVYQAMTVAAIVVVLSSLWRF